MSKENTRDTVKTWLGTTNEISAKVKDAVIDEMSKRGGVFEKIDKNFLDTIYAVKSVLSMINFGAPEEITEKDRDFVKRGIFALLDYAENPDRGYDQITQLRYEDCRDIFGASEDKAYINRTMSALFLTLVYFRRACVRAKLFDGDADIEAVWVRVAAVTRDILQSWTQQAEANGFTGWGFMHTSRETSLCDTYRVVDAISKYQDACDGDDKEKRDKEFVDMVDGGEGISSKAEEAVYRASLSVYDEASDCYGESVFYRTDAAAGERGAAAKSRYKKCDMEQILSSNRSSALFQPLYVALITIYGYTDKEVVIRRLMKSDRDYDEIMRRICEDMDGDEARASALELIKNYCDGVGYLDKPHAPLEELRKAVDGEAAETWRALYKEARGLERLLENNAAAEMMRYVREYREYLNKTKDAIDGVQVYYRKFSDAQKLGIVDTDYAIFSRDDVVSALPVEISRLNKSNIVTAYLRPLLLSAKVMIVNALIRYPQADMEGLFQDIMDSVHRKRTRGAAKPTSVMLWNEEEVDMYATACNCDSIAYDYYYYYSVYELNYRTMNKLREETEKSIKEKFGVKEAVLDFIGARADIERATGTENDVDKELVGLILDVSCEQIKALHSEYRRALDEKERDGEAECRLKEAEKEAALKEKESEYTAKLAARDAAIASDNNKIDYLKRESVIADVIKELIDEKIAEATDRAMGNMILLTKNPSSLITARMLDVEAATLDKFPACVRVAIDAMRRDCETLDDAGKRAYFERVTKETMAQRAAYGMALDGGFAAVIQSCMSEIVGQGVDDADLVELYGKFVDEKRDFETEWIDWTVKQRDGKGSLSNVFTAAKDRRFSILSGNKTDDDM